MSRVWLKSFWAAEASEKPANRRALLGGRLCAGAWRWYGAQTLALVAGIALGFGTTQTGLAQIVPKASEQPKPEEITRQSNASTNAVASVPHVTPEQLELARKLLREKIAELLRLAAVMVRSGAPTNAAATNGATAKLAPSPTTKSGADKAAAALPATGTNAPQAKLVSPSKEADKPATTNKVVQSAPEKKTATTNNRPASARTGKLPSSATDKPMASTATNGVAGSLTNLPPAQLAKSDTNSVTAPGTNPAAKNGETSPAKAVEVAPEKPIAELDKTDEAAAAAAQNVATNMSNLPSLFSLGNKSRRASRTQFKKPTPEELAEYERAATNGDPGAAFNLGLAYQRTGDTNQATNVFKWYLASALKNYAPAEANLGYCYDFGVGVRADPQIAAKWYLEAARQGNALAQYNLGKKYLSGRGVIADPKEAQKWFLRAAEQGLVEAYFCAGQGYANDKTHPDYANAFTMFRKAAERSGDDPGYAPAQHALGYIFQTGKLREKNDKEAMKWYQMAASQGFADSLYNLAKYYESGTIVTADPGAALRMYSEAANLGSPPAQYELGICYYNGIGTKPDMVQAFKWWSLAAAQGTDGEVRELAGRNLVMLASLMRQDEIAKGQQLAIDFVPAELPTDDPKYLSDAVPKPEKIKRVGTGCIITADGYVVINSHTISPNGSYRVLTEGGSFSAVLVRADLLKELAILKIDGTFQPLTLTSSRDATVGDGIMVVGFDNPKETEFKPTFVEGQITDVLGPDPRKFTLDPEIAPTFGGAAVVNRRGFAVGVMMSLSALEESQSATEAGVAPTNHIKSAMKSDQLLAFLATIPEVKPTVVSSKSGVEEKRDEMLFKVRMATVLVIAL